VGAAAGTAVWEQQLEKLELFTGKVLPMTLEKYRSSWWKGR
jgi:hypothetical protein